MTSMTTRRTLTALLCVLAASACVVSSADAEWSIDLYGGAAWIQSSDLKVRGEDDTHAVNLTIFDINTVGLIVQVLSCAHSLP